MARLFDDAQNEFLRINQAVLSGTPFVMGCWFNSNDLSIDQTLMRLGDKDADTSHWLEIQQATDKIIIVSRVTGVTSELATTTTVASVNTWHHACGLLVSATDRRVFIDGGSKGINTVSSNPTGFDRTSIGLNDRPSPASPMSGLIAEAAIWDLSLWPGATDADKADNFEKILPSLAAGYTSLFYPLGLVAYWPLIRDTDNDIVGGYNMTPINTPSIGVHPRIIMPYGQN